MFKLSIKDIIYLIIYAIPNTIFSFGILYIINNSISGGKEFFSDAEGWGFMGLVAGAYLLNIIFQKWLNRKTYKILYENEKIIFEKILNATLFKIEKSGMERFYTVVEDIRVFAFLPGTITHTVNAILMLMLCVVYLFTLSIPSALIVLGILIGVCSMYVLVIKTMTNKILKLREYNEVYYKYVDDLIKGFKGFKLDKRKRKNILNTYLYPNREKAEKIDYITNYIFLSINLISQYGLYFAVGVILFVLPETGLLEQKDVIAYVVVILFMTGPVNVLINMQSSFAKFSAANKRINSFLADFKEERKEDFLETINSNLTFDSIEFKNIEFNYENDLDKSFYLGPLNAKINKGETIFIIGGNGSGKSTFINNLTGLYKPSKGEIYVNNQSISDTELLQEKIAAVFTDNHIYSHNYDDYKLNSNELYSKWLEIMKMDDVVDANEDESARRTFSKGQGKRMSLIFALLENKPVLVLDEWAADQDPYFRKFFYEELIPKLKNEGKTIIAVTHDDAYFHMADRIIKFDYGKIVKEVNVKKEEAAKEMLWS
ncbi:cyclic peptide export ABC transporter [Aquimarina rhabdastrellae]